MGWYIVKGKYESVVDIPAGGLDKVIIKDLKTLKGVLNRIDKMASNMKKSFTIFTYSDFYNATTFKIEYIK